MANDLCIGCDLYSNGYCQKFRKNSKADPSDRSWFIRQDYEEPLNFISVDKMCRKSSIFGNEYIGLTQKDIERLKNGEVIHIAGEYGTFIGFVDYLGF